MKKRRDLEKDIQRSILNYFSARRIFHWRNNTGGFMRDNHFYRFGTKGSSDIFVLKEGRFYAIECKASTGRLTEDQKNFLDQISKNGGHGIVARSIDDIAFI